MKTLKTFFPLFAAIVGFIACTIDAVEPDYQDRFMYNCPLEKSYAAEGSAGTGNADAKTICPLESMVHNFDCINNQPVVMGRLVGIDHGDVLKRGDAYMTAWMLYWLCGDTIAGMCFVGENAEILTNEDWQDVERKNI